MGWKWKLIKILITTRKISFKCVFFHSNTDPTVWRVAYGHVKLSEMVFRSLVQKIINHKYYDPETNAFDVALLKLQDPITFTCKCFFLISGITHRISLGTNINSDLWCVFIYQQQLGRCASPMLVWMLIRTATPGSLVGGLCTLVSYLNMAAVLSFHSVFRFILPHL